MRYVLSGATTTTTSLALPRLECEELRSLQYLRKVEILVHGLGVEDPPASCTFVICCVPALGLGQPLQAPRMLIMKLNAQCSNFKV